MVKHYTSTKKFTNFPCTHRQWAADSHCRFVHGYARDFYFEFACKELTKEFWVMDFGGLKEVKAWLDAWFDHTFLASEDDPYLETWQKLDQEGVLQLRVLPNASMEATAKFVYDHVNKMVQKSTHDRVWVTMVEVRENVHNSGIFRA